MLRPKQRTIQNDRSGSSMGSEDTGDFDSSSVCFDAMSPSNVTVSLQPKSSHGASSLHAASVSHTTTAKSLGTDSIGSPSFGSISTVVSRAPSLAESIGSFDADKVQTEEKKALAGSGLLSGDISAAFPESIERAEEVLRYTRAALARADSHTGGSLGGSGDGRNGKLTTEELEELSRALKRALFVCPNHKGLHAVRGEVHRRLQDFRTAVGSLRLAVRMDKSALNVRQRLAEVLLSQGMVWLDGGDHKAALECFEEACTVDGANASAHFCKTIALVKLARFGEALRGMEAVLGRRKGTADDYVLRAKIQWAVGMVGPGNDDMDTARSLRSDHPEVVMFSRRCLGDAASLYDKAKAFADAGNDQMAVKVLNQVAELTPDDVKVPIVRAACKRRLQDFVGALCDYDESSFRHFEGVHVGRKALHQAADRLRDLRGRVSGGRGDNDGMRGVAAAETKPTTTTTTTTTTGGGGGGVVGGGDAEGEVAASSAAGGDAESDGGTEISSSYRPSEKVKVHRGKGHGNGNAVVDGSAAPDGGEVAERHTAAVRGQEVERAAGVRVEAGEGGAVLAAGATLPVRDGSLKSTSGVGRDGGGATAKAAVGNTEKLEETVAAQAVNERLDEAELRVRFRLAISHAGPDPAYTLRPSSRFTQQQQQLQRARQERQSFSLFIPPSASSHVSGSFAVDAGVPQREEEGEGEEGGGEGEGEGEGYTEPAYITRQRCLVLNEWALSLFESGEYAKAVLALNLAIEGDKAFARATGGAVESKFFLNRGDCYRASGATEMAVRDYKRALEVEPGNWMVKTRLSLAHYLKGNSLFNNGVFSEAKSELDIAIAYNWKVSAYYLLRGHAQYFGGWISDAHIDYRKALQLDPGNVEARRLCRQFDSKGKLENALRSGRGREEKIKLESHLPGPSASSGAGRRPESALPLPLLPSPSPPPSSSSHSVAAPRHRPSRDEPQLRAPASPNNRYSSGATPARTAKTVCRCTGCGASAGGCKASNPATKTRLSASGRSITGVGAHGGGCSWKQAWQRPARRRRAGKFSLPVVDTRPPKPPEWRESAVSWAKAGEDGVKRVFNERFGGVPARDERLWGMLRPCRKRGWSSAGTGADGHAGGGATATSTATSLGGGVSVSSSGKNALGSVGLLSRPEGRG